MAIAAITAGLALLSCSGEASPPADGHPSAGASADGVFPDHGFSDWVTYGRAVVVVDVLSETELPHTPEVDKNGEGYVGRSVTLRVARALWTAPNTDAAPTQFDTIDWGWLLKNGKLLPFNQSRLEVGHRYLVPLVEIDGKLGSLVLDAIPVGPDAIAATGRPANTWETAELAGLSLDTVAQRLAATSIDPVAAPFMDLPAVQRAEAVRTAKGQPRLTND